MAKKVHKNLASAKHTLPNFLVIGAMKCGTTSLHHYLTLHPEIFMSRQKELSYFVEERNYSNGEAWYRAQFESGFHACGEISPAYTAYPVMKGVPQRIHSLLGDIRLIYVMRDPLERLLSHYIHNVAKGKETRTFDEAMRNLENDYVWRSLYSVQLKQYLPYFARERILLITQEDLLNQRVSTLRRIFRFLGVRDEIHVSVNRKLHTTRSKRRPSRGALSVGAMLDKVQLSKLCPRVAGVLYEMITYPISYKIEKPVFDEDKHKILRKLLRDDVQCLEKLTGQKFEQWQQVRG